MVSLRETIKGFALACKREALDRPPPGDHGNPKGYDQALLKSSILTACMD